MKKRYLSGSLEDICFKHHKMAFISGPRQCGKTTLAKMTLKERGVGSYHNWDETQFRRLWVKEPQSIIPQSKGKTPLIIFDEIHKAKLWKRTLKGIYDSMDDRGADIIVTGSARLNVYKKGSDSLMGRYFHFRLHPFSLGELEKGPPLSPKKIIDNVFEKPLVSSKQRQATLRNLLHFGGFPEPFLAQSDQILRLWQKGRKEKVIREDLRDLTRIPELSQIEMLVSLLPEQIGSFLSRASLRSDLEVSFDTVRRWIIYLKELYYLFEIKPYQQNIKRSLKKEGKVYLWDFSEVVDEAARFENLVACHLLKFCHFWTDCGEGEFELFCLRDKQQHEIDFLICKDAKPWLPVEAKLNNAAPSANWGTFLKQLPCKKGLQIVLKDNIWQHHKNQDGQVLVASASDVLPFFV